ncbi:MAG TPA: hypothetical protein VMR96_01900, partial [Solirubrobacterales bacterium]|nr:hypothetical protein [Solirubrobacterales bacterium]
PEPMQPLRPSDSPGAKVMPPTPEIFPGGSWELPWVATPEDPRLSTEYAAGAACATVEGSGELLVQIDDGERQAVRIDGPGLYTLAEHAQHEAHRLTLEPAGKLRVWSLSFAAGLP